MFSPAVAAAREYVRLYGPLPESGAGKSVIEAYQAETGKIQEAMKAGTYEPPPNIIAGVYDIKTQRGIKKFVATDEAQVKRLAESHGLIVGGIKKIKDEKLTPYEAVKRMTTAQQQGEMSAAEALITYGRPFGGELGERYFGESYEPPPKDSIPIRTDEGVVYITKDAANELKATSAYKEAKGTDANKLSVAFEANQENFKNWLKQLKRDSPDLYKLYEEGGFDALNKAIGRQTKEQQQLLSKLEPYKQEKGYDITTALVKEAITPSELKLLGFSGSDIKDATMAAVRAYPRLMDKLLPEEEWQKLEKDFTALPKKKSLAGFPGRESQEWYIREFNASAQYTGRAVPDKPYSELSNEDQRKILEWYSTSRPEYWRQQAKSIGKIVLGFVPIAGTIAYWNEMSPALKAFSIAGDIACIIPLIHGAAVAARAAKGYTAAARMKAALKGAGQMAIAELTAPADILAYPIDTAKGIGRQIQSIAETLAHPKKLPLGAAELSYTTARLPVEDVGDAAKAMQLRDAAVEAAIHGKAAKATVGDITLTLTPSELQKVGGAMAVHSTPDVRPYLNGAIVKGGAGGSGVFISPNWHSRFAQATAFGDIPEDGIKGGLIIREQNVLSALAPTGKTYMSTVEMEALLKPGTILPPPSQILVMRDAAGYRLTLLVIGEPFTQTQIAKLKFLGSLDTIGQIFKPTMTLTGAERTAISSMDDIISLSRERVAIAEQLTAARSAGAAAKVQVLSQRITDIDQRISNLTERVNAPREAVRPGDIVWAEYTDKGILERWRELNPREARVTPRGARLSDIRVGEIIRRERPSAEERRIPAGERIAPPKGRRVPAHNRLYTPSYAPQYVPAHIPPYTPLKPSLHMPPSSRYAPTRITRTPAIKAPPPPSQKQMRVKVMPTKLGSERMPRPGQALQVWDQGLYWISIFEPFRTTGTKPDVIYSRHKPPWAGRTTKGKHSPQKTFRAIGSRHPKLVTLPMGAVTARVSNGRRLTFSRNSSRRRGRLVK